MWDPTIHKPGLQQKYTKNNFQRITLFTLLIAKPIQAQINIKKEK